MPHKTAELGCVFQALVPSWGPEARWLASVAGLGWTRNRPEVDDRSRLLRLSWIASHPTWWLAPRPDGYPRHAV